MTPNDKVRDLVTELRYGYALNEAADLIEKLTGEPSEGMVDVGIGDLSDFLWLEQPTHDEKRDAVIDWFQAMTTQAIKEVLGDE